MTIPGDPSDACLLPLLEHARELAGVPLGFFDAHTHMGQNDPDGRKATAEEIIAGLDRGGHERALIFPMHEPGGYVEANGAALEAARASGGRLLALARLDPHQGEAAVQEAERRADEGAAGFKLHPRSDAFDLPNPVVERLVALAGERRLIVLFHAGRGFPGLGAEVGYMAARHPGARLVLAHAGISDLGQIAEVAGQSSNIFFDTAWWQVSDLLTLFANVPPGRILYASDMPYGAARFSSLAFLRCAMAAGLRGDALTMMAGGQLERLVAGEDPVELGPAPGEEVLGARDLTAERGLAYLAAAVQIGFRGGDPTEPLSLARLALRPARTDAVAAADALVACAQDELPLDPRHPQAVTYPALAAQLVLGTARLGAPV